MFLLLQKFFFLCLFTEENKYFIKFSKKIYVWKTAGKNIIRNTLYYTFAIIKMSILLSVELHFPKKIVLKVKVVFLISKELHLIFYNKWNDSTATRTSVNNEYFYVIINSPKYPNCNKSLFRIVESH